jgi:hypothetical protein
MIYIIIGLSLALAWCSYMLGKQTQSKKIKEDLIKHADKVRKRKNKNATTPDAVIREWLRKNSRK